MESDSTKDHQEASEGGSQPASCDKMVPGLLQTLDKTEVLEYINFSSSLNTTAALNSSFGISVAPNECDNANTESDLVNMNENCGLSEHEVDVIESVPLPDKPSANKSFVIEENIKNGASLPLHDLNSVNDQFAVSPITGETLPNVSCNMSDLDIEPPASLSFFGATPSPVNVSTFLGKSLIKFSDSPLLKSLLLDNMSKQSKDVDAIVDTPKKIGIDSLHNSHSVTKNSSIHLINFSAEIELPTAECVPHENSGDPFTLISKIADMPRQSAKSDIDKDNGETIHIQPTSHLLAGENKAEVAADQLIDDTETPKAMDIHHDQLLCMEFAPKRLIDNIETPKAKDHLHQLLSMEVASERIIDDTETPETMDICNDRLIPVEVAPEPLISMNISSSGDVNENLFNETHCFPVPLVELKSPVPSDISVQDKALSVQHDNDAEKRNHGLSLLDEGKLNPISASVALNETMCLGPTNDDEHPKLDKLEESISNTLNLTRTFSGNKLRDLLSDAAPCAAGINSCEDKKDNGIVTSSADYLENSPSLPAKIADISAISGDGMCLEVSDVFDTEIPCFILDKHNTSCNVPSSSRGQIRNSTPAASRRQSMFVASSAVKQSSQAQNLVKPLKKNVVSKVKMLIEAKDTTATNQENISVRSTPTQKKPGKWDAITSKISAGLNKTKTPEIKEIASKVNTNVNIVRHSTPKTSPGRSFLKNDKNKTNKSLQSSESTGAKNLKNSLSSQRDEDKSSDKGNKESRILTQLQNVNTAKQSDGFKVPLFPVSKRKIGGSQLPSPCGSASSAASSIPNMSKIAMAKRDVSKVPNASSNTSKTAKFIPVPQPSPKVGSALKKPTPKDSSIKDAKSSRWPSGVSSKTPPRPEAKKFVSKTELVREIQELGATCENRTKELNLLKMRLRHAALGFEAMAILNKYMVEEFDPYAQPRLARQYEKAKEELSIIGQQLHLYHEQLKDLQAVHAEELMELTEKLGVVHEDEINELKSNHVAELAEVDRNHKRQVKQLREDFKKQAEENEERNIRMFKELQDDYQKQKKELETNHAKKLQKMTSYHEEIQHQLQKRLESLNDQYSSLQRQLKEAEEAFMKDKNSKIQYISAKKTELEKEVDSLKAVLEIKTTQIQDLHMENFKIKKELEELPAAKEKIRKLETKTEDLKALMQEKVKMHRELSTENQQLVLICEKEAKNNTRLSMANEELHWRLQRSMEENVRSTSLCASPDLWNRDEEDQRSSSRMSLPILQSEKLRTGTESSNEPSSPARGDDWPVVRGHSMSMSWHPALPTHEESPLVPTTSTPLARIRSSSARGTRLPPQVKLSSFKLKKEIEAEIIRRNSLARRQLPLDKPQPCNSSMSMSWGGETFADYYEELDDSSLQTYNDHRKGMSRKFFIRYDNLDKPRKSRRTRQSMPANFRPDGEIDIDKSISGLTSMQSSFYSSTDSSSSFLPTQPGSEASNSSSPSSDNKSQDSSGFLVAYDVSPSCVKPPQELAGESMIQELESVSQVLLKSSANMKKDSGCLGLTDVSSSSPEDAKDNGANLTSVATPSIETSSQGMADSTNLDVSWGDEEMMSEND